MTPFATFIPESLEERLQDGIRHALSLGAEGAEVFLSVSRSRKAKVQNGALEDLTVSKRGGLGVRVIRAGSKGFRTGLATTTDLAASDFRELFAQAWELSALGDEDPWLRQADPSGADDLPSRFNPEVEAITPEQRIAWALDLEAQARRASAKVAAVRESAWSDGSGASLLLTQKGVRTPDVWSSCSAAIELAVADAEERQAAWHWE
ncbi:MAG TPA: DNA gyrase modulator, partial [Geothrix sp.]|nr:DNA gyrase modulator [Geothrix sp.]